MVTSLSIATSPFETGPNASSTAAPAPQGDASSRQAWQREMERVQAERWFRHEAGSTASAPEGPQLCTASSCAPEARQESRQPRPPLAWAGVKADPGRALRPGFGNGALSGTMYWVGPASGADTPRECLGEQEALAVMPPDVRPGGRALPGAVSKERQEAFAHAAGTQDLPQDLQERPPVRVHVQWNDGVAHVWVGVDTPADSERSAVVLAVLRQLRDQGMTVGRLTCNGSEVLIDPGHQDAAPIFTVSTDPSDPGPVTNTKQREF